MSRLNPNSLILKEFLSTINGFGGSGSPLPRRRSMPAKS